MRSLGVIHAGAVGLVLIIGFLSVVVGVVVLFPVAAVRGGVWEKAPRGGCLVCKSPVGQRKGFCIFHQLQTLRAHPANLAAQGC